MNQLSGNDEMPHMELKCPICGNGIFTNVRFEDFVLTLNVDTKQLYKRELDDAQMESWQCTECENYVPSDLEEKLDALYQTIQLKREG